MLKKIVILFILILWPVNLLISRDLPKPEIPKTIFAKDYQAEQLILRNIHLYPNVILARVFQNKGRIYLNKFTDNFFALTDPNNYFFGLHPRPIVPNNRNLFKFPFIGIIFFGYGIFTIKKYKYKPQLITAFSVLIAILSVLKNFDGYDFVLWIPVSIVIIHGIQMLETDNPKIFKATAIALIIFAVPEIIRSFLTKT